MPEFYIREKNIVYTTIMIEAEDTNSAIEMYEDGDGEYIDREEVWYAEGWTKISTDINFGGDVLYGDVV